jgi:SNF-related kinase
LQESGCQSIPLVPLISRSDLTDDEHAFIVQKMLNGQIASKDEIVQ